MAGIVVAVTDFVVVLLVVIISVPLLIFVAVFVVVVAVIVFDVASMRSSVFRITSDAFVPHLK